MAEIKSAIELAMERTKSLVLDDDEKQALATKETQTKIRALVRRFREGMIDDDDFGKEFSRIDMENVEKRTLLIDVIAGELDFQRDEERLLGLLTLAGVGLSEEAQGELEILKKRCSGDLEMKELIIRQRVTERLGQGGITGDALVPNLEAWDEWKEGREETVTVFRKRLRAWTERLQEGSGSHVGR
jgi:hypothetical protein